MPRQAGKPFFDHRMGGFPPLPAKKTLKKDLLTAKRIIIIGA